jgi:hypothetical protein
MKAITIWQPWAQLVAIGAKEYETRTFAPKYRGPVAIHAGKRKQWGGMVIPYEPFRTPLRDAGIVTYETLPLGCVVAVGELTAIYATRELFLKLSKQERDFGDFTPGRYAWRIQNMRMLEEPIPVKGQQGLWEWEAPEWVESLVCKEITDG